MRYPKITVITPSYNQAKFIERTILSVLNQNYPNLEYLVFDGLSTDGTINILEKYTKHLTFVSEKDSGQVEAINKGLKLSTGDIIAYLNSDDTYTESALFEVAEAYNRSSKPTWFIGTCKIINSENKVIQIPITLYKNLWLKLYSYQTLLCLNYICQPSVFWTRKVLEEVGLFNNEYYGSFDYEYWLRVGKNSKPMIINKPLSNFRIHKDSFGSNSYKKQFTEELEIAKKHTPNRIIHGLHYLNYLSIMAVYRFTR